jgi:hypothetical protein
VQLGHVIEIHAFDPGDHLHHPGQVIIHIAEVLANVLVHEAHRALGESAQRRRQRSCRPAQCEDLALEYVQSIGVGEPRGAGMTEVSSRLRISYRPE